MESKSNYYQI